MFVHALNCTACATERTMSCILENNQQKDGSIIVPKILRAFIGKDVI
jgi:seryl-tRNA synthetase